MTTLEKAKQRAGFALSLAAGPGVEIKGEDFSRPPQAEMGDLSYPCFALAKHLKTNPAAVAAELAGKITSSPGERGLIKDVKAVGPYVNFFFDHANFATSVLEDVLGHVNHYGAAPRNDEKILIEYGSVNTHKEVHVGHLLNLSLGQSIGRILEGAGAKVTHLKYIGDVGAHVAKWLWYYDKIRRGDIPDRTVTEHGKMIPFGKIYTEATLAAEAGGDAAKAEISAVLQKLEAHDPELESEWLKTRDECLAQIDFLFTELGIHFVRTYLESEVEGPGKELVQDMLAKGIAKEGEKGAIIVDLEDEKLGVFLALKSDGTALYSTKELALAGLKFSEYPETTQSMHVVDNRQSLYFKQFFATLKRMGFEKPMTHISHDFVTLSEGAMSSRKGNIITYEDFRDQMKSMVIGEVAKRHEDWTLERQEKTAWIIAEGAMKFGMLKQEADRPLVFDMEAALSFDGFTGPYVQYAHARLSTILNKAVGETVSVCSASADPAEYALLRKVADLPEVVLAAAKALRPSLMAQYVFELAQQSNEFYRDVPVLTAEPADRARRLAVVAVARVALANGLHALGIRAPEEM